MSAKGSGFPWKPNESQAQDGKHDGGQTGDGLLAQPFATTGFSIKPPNHMLQVQEQNHDSQTEGGLLIQSFAAAGISTKAQNHKSQVQEQKHGGQTEGGLLIQSSTATKHGAKPIHHGTFCMQQLCDAPCHRKKPEDVCTAEQVKWLPACVANDPRERQHCVADL
jgi:hypothetical protein